MVELLKQGQYTPFHIVDQVISVFAGSKGYLDDVAVTDVRQFEMDLLKFFQASGKPAWNALNEKKALDAETEKKLEEAIKSFKSTWKPAK